MVIRLFFSVTVRGQRGKAAQLQEYEIKYIPLHGSTRDCQPALLELETPVKDLWCVLTVAYHTISLG